MTDQNHHQKKQEVKFLDRLYADINALVKRLYPDYNSSEWSLVDDIFSTVEPYVKQSWKNGIQAGRREARQKESQENEAS